MSAKLHTQAMATEAMVDLLAKRREERVASLLHVQTVHDSIDDFMWYLIACNEHSLSLLALAAKASIA
jgi:hypothetical protein